MTAPVQWMPTSEPWKLRAFRLAKAVTILWMAAGIAAGRLTVVYHACFRAGASHACDDTAADQKLAEVIGRRLSTRS